MLALSLFSFKHLHWPMLERHAEPDEPFAKGQDGQFSKDEQGTLYLSLLTKVRNWPIPTLRLFHK